MVLSRAGDIKKMKRGWIIGTVAKIIYVGAAAASPSPDKALHSSDWYSTHRPDDLQVLRECANDRTYENYPDCKNAVAGDHLWIGRNLSTGSPNSSSRFMNDSLRAVELARCQKITIPTARPPQADCDAAARIQARIDHGGS